MARDAASLRRSQLHRGAEWLALGSQPELRGRAENRARANDTGVYEPLLTFPSGGETSYAGLAWHGGMLRMSYHALHERKSAIYLAKVKLADGIDGK